MNSLEVVLPAKGQLQTIAAAKNLPPFGEIQLGFAAALSRELTAPTKARAYPELTALGFWLRPANLARLIKSETLGLERNLYAPRGLAFHIAPSNVDTIFVYSWLISLLCGNRNIVRISSRSSEQTRVLTDLLQTLLQDPQWDEIARRVLLVRYGHDDQITARLSQLCDIRVIWGGDATISAIRTLPLQPHATELAFTNKFSVCVMDAAAINGCNKHQLDNVAKAFYNDAYWFGQMACSSPRLVLWRGADSAVAKARRVFWGALEERLSQEHPPLGAADFMNKVVAADSLAIATDVKITSTDNRLTRIWLEHISIHPELHCGAGLFHEARISTLSDLLPYLDRKIQTLCHFGLGDEEIVAFVRQDIPAGIDRFVQVGHALDFGPIWDGQDLFRAFVRQIAI